MERNLGEWRRMNVMEWMNECTRKYKIRMASSHQTLKNTTYKSLWFSLPPPYPTYQKVSHRGSDPWRCPSPAGRCVGGRRAAPPPPRRPPCWGPPPPPPPARPPPPSRTPPPQWDGRRRRRGPPAPRPGGAKLPPHPPGPPSSVPAAVSGLECNQ